MINFKTMYCSLFITKLKKYYYIKNNTLFLQNDIINLRKFEHNLIINKSENILWIREFHLDNSFTDYSVSFNSAYIGYFNNLNHQLNNLK